MNEIVEEVCIYLVILTLIIPATVWACILTIKEMMFKFPDEIYEVLKAR